MDVDSQIIMNAKRKMNLFVETIKNHSDFIFSPSEITPELAKPIAHLDSKLQNSYMLLDKSYRDEGVVHNRQLLLSQISKKASNCFAWHYLKTYRLVNEVASLLHLNQFELAH